MYILALDTHPTVATAQAFMQGFYPPLILNESTAGMLDPSSVLANKTYVRPTSSMNADEKLTYCICRLKALSVDISTHRSVLLTTWIRSSFSSQDI
jgi:hypothetical protein